MAYAVKNWEEHQHFTRRRPTWIKLHHELLNDRKFQSLPVASRALLPMVWLLASEFAEGVINVEDTDIAFRVHWPIDAFHEAFKSLIDRGFIINRNEQNQLTRNFPQSQSQSQSQREKERTDKTLSSAPVDLFEQDIKPEPTKAEIRAQAAAAAQAEITEAVAAYNALAKPNGPTQWPACNKVTEKRARAIAKMLDDESTGGLDGWRATLARAARSSWLNGSKPRGNGHENWQPDILYLARPDTIAEISEGKHDDKTARLDPKQQPVASRAGNAFAGIRRARPG